MSELQRGRIAKGLCPNCGKEAAPYYLCHGCRMTARVARACRSLGNAGGFRREMRGGRVYWSMADNSKCDEVIARSRAAPTEGDRRLEPKLRRMRVDVEATVLEVIKVIGRPCTLEEIMSGWGALRAKRDAPLANDLARIIAAQDKRARKAAKLQSQDPPR